MKNFVQILIRTAIIVALVSLVTAGVYFSTGGQTKQGLSDGMVYASFIALTAGTLSGIFRIGYRGNIEEEEAKGELGAFERSVKVFFKAGMFGVALTLAGLLCFLVGVLVDVLF